MKIYLVKLKIADKQEKTYFTETECTDLTETEKGYTIKVNGCLKLIPEEGINLIKVNSLARERNAENYENYIYTDDIEMGKSMLIGAYHIHVLKAQRAMRNYIKLGGNFIDIL